MAERRTKARASRTRDTYLALVRRFPLRPIRNEAELDTAIAVIVKLTGRDDLDTGGADYLDVLGDRVERYEDKAHPTPTDDLSDAEMLAHLIEAKGVKHDGVARATGIAESTLSGVLRGKRRLTRGQIVKLAATFKGPGVFLSGEGERAL